MAEEARDAAAEAPEAAAEEALEAPDIAMEEAIPAADDALEAPDMAMLDMGILAIAVEAGMADAPMEETEMSTPAALQRPAAAGAISAQC